MVRHQFVDIHGIPKNMSVHADQLEKVLNNEIMLDQLEKGEYERARQVVAWYLWAAKSYGVKAVMVTAAKPQS